MSLRLLIMKYKAFLGRIGLFLSLFLCFHFLVIPTLLRLKHGGLRKTGWKASTEAETIMYYKPLDVVSANEAWQVVNDPVYEIYLLSAFFDDRAALTRFYVRVVAVAEVGTKDITCLLWYRNRKEPDAFPVNMTFVGDKVEQHGKLFQGVILSCKVPAQRWPPEWVSIVSRDSIVPSNLVRVELPYRPPMLRDMTVCVPPSYGDLSPQKFTEWLELLSYMGVTKVTIYDRGIFQSVRKVIKSFAEKGIVDLRRTAFPLQDGNTTLARRLMSAATINDCFYRNMMEHSKVMVVDIDEIIVPRIHDTYPELLTYIDDILPPHPGRSYIFKSVYFWLDFPPFTEDTPFMTITRYLMRTPPSAMQETERSITDTQVCLALSANQCQEVLPEFKNLTDWLTPVNMNMSLLHHYKKCDLDQKYDKPGLCNKTYSMATLDPTGLKYIDKITTQVVETLWKFDLVDIFNLAEESVRESLKDEAAMNATQQKEEKGEGKEEKEEELDSPIDPMVIVKDMKVNVAHYQSGSASTLSMIGQTITENQMGSDKRYNLDQGQNDKPETEQLQKDRQGDKQKDRQDDGQLESDRQRPKSNDENRNNEVKEGAEQTDKPKEDNKITQDRNSQKHTKDGQTDTETKMTDKKKSTELVEKSDKNDADGMKIQNVKDIPSNMKRQPDNANQKQMSAFVNKLAQNQVNTKDAEVSNANIKPEAVLSSSRQEIIPKDKQRLSNLLSAKTKPEVKNSNVDEMVDLKNKNTNKNVGFNKYGNNNDKYDNAKNDNSYNTKGESDNNGNNDKMADHTKSNKNKGSKFSNIKSPYNNNKDKSDKKLTKQTTMSTDEKNLPFKLPKMTRAEMLKAKKKGQIKLLHVVEY